MKIIKDAMLKILGSLFHVEDDFPKGHFFYQKGEVLNGQPTLDELYLLHWEPNGGQLFFSPILPLTLRDGETMLKIVRECMTEYGFHPFPELVVTAREVHCLNVIMDHVADAKQRRNASLCMQKMIKPAAE